MSDEWQIEDIDDAQRTIRCPSCDYTRKPDDDERTPPWQCPRCHVAYVKVGVDPELIRN